MSDLIARVVIATRLKMLSLGERGQATAEFSVVMIVAVALGLAVVALFTKGMLDDVLHAIIAKALDVAADRID